MFSEKMTSIERKAVFSLSSIMALRMIGLFMVLPVFALYAEQLSGTTPFLLGLAIGIYGLFQALFQIPFGALSDRIGRKPVIVFGLAIFAIGSLIAGFADSIYWMIFGRALQGAGAVGSTILAMMADLTREHQRTKSMAIAGISIGFSFSLAMLIGPLLTKWLPVNGLFFLAVLFSFAAVVILFYSVPTPLHVRWHRDTEPEFKAFFSLLISADLAKLNIGIFILHAVFTASFVVIPISLYRFAGLAAESQWLFYLPSLLIAFIASIACIGIAERRQQVKPFFLAGIFSLAIAEILLWQAHGNWSLIAISLCLFFTGFSLLEAFLPSLISRTAPHARKGTALGIYSCSQFFGIFVGGIFGGWLYGKFSFTGVYLFCIIITLFWLFIAYLMKAPPFLVNYMLRFSSSQPATWQTLIEKLQFIPGMKEVTFIAEEGIAYLKMERKTTEHPDFIHLKEQLQSD